MTDQELDQMMRRALLDAAAQEAEALPLSLIHISEPTRPY